MFTPLHNSFFSRLVIPLLSFFAAEFFTSIVHTLNLALSRPDCKVVCRDHDSGAGRDTIQRHSFRWRPHASTERATLLTLTP
jgi:hypothetical protein